MFVFLLEKLLEYLFAHLLIHFLTLNISDYFTFRHVVLLLILAKQQKQQQQAASQQQHKELTTTWKEFDIFVDCLSFRLTLSHLSVFVISLVQFVGIPLIEWSLALLILATGLVLRHIALRSCVYPGSVLQCLWLLTSGTSGFSDGGHGCQDK